MKALLFLLVFPFMQAHAPHACEVKGPDFDGSIFDKDYEMVFLFHDQKSRITLYDKDINKAEAIIRRNIKIANRLKPYQFNGLPVIDENLERYNRQYVGYTNSKNEKIVWVNFVWNTFYQKELPNEVIRKFDGCSYFWNIKVNLSTSELFDLDVNFCG